MTADDRRVYLDGQARLDKAGEALFGSVHWERLVDPISGQFVAER